MDIIQIVVIGIIASILSILLKKDKPEFSLIITMAAGVLIFLMIIPKLSAVLTIFHELTSKISLDFGYVNIILKVVGISYIAEFGMQLCLDAEEKAIAAKIELAAKIIILYVSSPILLTLVELILNLI